MKNLYNPCYTKFHSYHRRSGSASLALNCRFGTELRQPYSGVQEANLLRVNQYLFYRWSCILYLTLDKPLHPIYKHCWWPDLYLVSSVWLLRQTVAVSNSLCYTSLWVGLRTVPVNRWVNGRFLRVITCPVEALRAHIDGRQMMGRTPSLPVDQQPLRPSNRLQVI
jgi:hypothetical protein